MTLIALHAFADNYIWLWHNDHHALVVDPGDSAPVLAWMRAHPGVQLDTILVTHHHADHTGGLAELVALTGAQVYAPALEKMPVATQGLAQGDHVDWHGLRFEVHEVPGHTLGHIAFWAHVSGQAPLLFSGDTLFSGGCGRLFEGTAGQMLDSLDRLSALPEATRVCCAHEYTLANLKFALTVEPDNLALQAHWALCTRLRAQDLPTLPVALHTERAINPFLRSRTPSVAASVARHACLATDSAQDDVTTFAALRQWKNDFR